MSARLPPNPFAAGAPPSAAWCFGREDALDRLVQAFENPQVVEVELRGPRGIGKSTLIAALEQRVHGAGVVVAVDLRRHLDALSGVRAASEGGPYVYDGGAQHLRESSDAVAQAIALAITDLFDEVRVGDPERITAEFLLRDVLPAVCSSGRPRLVLVLDEFDLISPNIAQRLWSEFVSPKLRRLSSPPLFLRIVGTAWGPGLTVSGEDFRGVGITLGLLGPSEIRQLGAAYQRAGLFGFDDVAVDLLATESAGYPLLLASLLDAVYRSRWEESKRATIEVVRRSLGVRDVEAAAAQVAAQPPERIRHALLQAGPAALKTLISLAREEGGIAGRESLIEAVSHAWRVSEAEVARSLTALTDAHLLKVDGELVAIRAPLLARIARDFGERHDLAELEAPPSPEVFAAMQLAERFEHDRRKDRAIDGYFLAGRLAPDHWQAAWGEARLRLERARVEGSGCAEDLARADLLLTELLRRLSGTRRAAMVVRALQETLTRRAAHAPKGSTDRERLLTRLRDDAIDPYLRTPNARAVWDEHRVARWQAAAAERGEALRDETRRLLQEVLDRSLVLQAVTHNLRSLRPREGHRHDAIAFLGHVLPAVADGSGVADDDVAFWDEVLRTLTPREGVALEMSAPFSDVEAWEALAQAPPTHRREIARLVGPGLRDLVTRVVIEEPTPEPERYVEALRALAPELLPQALDALGGRTLEGLREASQALLLVEPLGRALRCFLRAEAGGATALAQLFAEAVAEFGDGNLPARTAAVTAWRELLTPENEKVRRFLDRLEVRATAEELGREVSDADREVARGLLDREYEIVRRCTTPSAVGTSPQLQGTVRAFEARGPDGAPVLLRLVGVKAPDDATFNVVRGIFELEQRLLSALSQTPEGRALPRLLEGRVSMSKRQVVLVREWLGERSLRDLLRERRRALRTEENSVALWRELAGLAEALHAMHRHRYLHRSLSPSAVLSRDESFLNGPPASDGRPALFLVDFEMTVYLRGLRFGHSVKAEQRTRYLAPEVLCALLQATPADGYEDVGETFASDLYAFGLLLFECVVEPLDGSLGRYTDATSYDAAAQREHRSWLGALQEKVRRAALAPQERDLIVSLLHPSLGSRENDSEAVLEQVRSLASGRAFGRGSPPTALRAFTTLGPSDWYVSRPPLRDDPRCIAWFLRGRIPEIDAVPPEELSPDELRKLIERELKGATLFRNANRVGQGDDPSLQKRVRWFPLVVRSRSGLLFRAQPFRWRGREDEPYAEFRGFGYLEVARLGDAATGDPIATLRDGIALDPLEPAQVRLRRDEAARQIVASWAGYWPPRSGEPEDPLAEARRRLLQAVRLDVELAYRSARAELRFVTTENRMRCEDEGVNLAIAVDGWTRDDTVVLLARTPTDRGIPVGLDPARFDFEVGTIELPDEFARKFPRGLIRPWAEQGTDALFRRHSRVLDALADDPTLLDAVVAPGALPPRREARKDLPVVLARLDDDKRAIARRFHEVPSLLVVEGPPGTGKTTLAAEIILEVLQRNPHARILVTTQSHDPLDNLLERLLQEREASAGGGRKGGAGATAREILEPVEIIRIPSGQRARSYGRGAAHLPDERATRMTDALLLWAQQNRSAIGHRQSMALGVLAADGADHRLRASNALRRRLIQSANLVFCTASAADLEGETPGAFDLVIFEEAARAPVVEVLGAMHLARRWLLIGDHRQLPPYQAAALDDKVDDYLRQELRTQREESPEAEAVARRDIEDTWRRYRRIFEALHRTEGDHRTTLETQWRMHPALGEMVSEVFYEGQAVKNPTGDAEGLLRKQCAHPFTAPDWVRERPIVWIDMPWAGDDPRCGEQRFVGGGLGNEAERRVLVALLRTLQTGKPTDDIAILTPYRLQVQSLAVLLAEKLNWFDAVRDVGRKIFTVDAFQGRQAGTVVLSLVRNNVVPPRQRRGALGFLDMPERNAVMFSRAEKLLVVIGCSEQFRRIDEDHWTLKVYEHAKRAGGVITPAALPLANAEIAKVRLLRKGTLLTSDGTEVKGDE